MLIFFKNLSLQKKLFGAFALVALVCLLVGLTGWWGSARLNTMLLRVSNEDVPALEAIQSLSQSLAAMKASERTLLDATLPFVEREREYVALKKVREGARQAIEQVGRFDHGVEESALWQDFLAQFAEWETNLDDFLLLSQEFDAEKISNPAQLALEAQQKLVSYQSWAMDLSDNIADAAALTVETDPLKTEIGLWIQMLRTENPEVEAARRQVLTQLQAAQKSMGTIKDFFEIEEVDLAREIFVAEVRPSIVVVGEAIGNLSIPIRTALSQQHQMQQQALTVSAPLIESSQQLLAKLVSKSQGTMIENSRVAESLVTKVNRLLGASILVGVVSAMTLGLIFTRSIVGPLGQTVDMIEELAKGHIGQRLALKRNDEIGRLGQAMDGFADSLQAEVIEPLQKLAQGDLTFAIQAHDSQDVLRGAIEQLGCDLNQVLGEIQQAGVEINSGSRQLSDASQSLSDGATASAASLEQIAASMNQIGTQSQQSAENAQQANTLAVQARQAADDGVASMERMISAMGEINASSYNISKIIKVIDEIAFQTNLLALNAAVEAARAGQHGKGFAVVAEEVRNLAARSAKAAEETAELIEGSVQKASNGTQIAEKTGTALSGILAGITKVSDFIGEITAASHEQAQGVRQVNEGLEQIDRVVQQNTASAEESAATSQQLAGQAEHLQQLLERFRLHQSGSGAEGPSVLEWDDD